MIAAERCTIPGVFLSVYELLIWRALARGPRNQEQLAETMQCECKAHRRELMVILGNMVDRGIIEKCGECYRRMTVTKDCCV